MKVRYIGPKASIGVHLPADAESVSVITSRHHLARGASLELPDEQAEIVVARGRGDFELVPDDEEPKRRGRPPMKKEDE